MAIDAEQLNIILSAKDKEFARAMKANESRVKEFSDKANKSLSSTTAYFGKLSGGMAALLPALSAAALVASVKSVVSSLDEIGKTADRIGITTDALQELRVIGESAGVSFDTMTSSIEKLSRNIAEAANGTGAARDAFNRLGLSAASLKQMGAEQALSVIADKMNTVENASERTALAIDIFGKSGAPMLNLLREGSEGMDKMREEARKLGIVIDEALIRKAEDAQTQLDLMSRVISANLSSALINLAPILVNTAQGIAGLSRAVAEFLNISGNGLVPQIDTMQAIKDMRGLEAETMALARARAKLNDLEAQAEAGKPPEIPQLDAAYAAIEAAEEALKIAKATRDEREAAAQSTLELTQTVKQETKALQEQAEANKLSAEQVERRRIATERLAYEEQILNGIRAAGKEIDDETFDQVMDLGAAWEQAAISASKILTPIEKTNTAARSTAASVQEVNTKLAEMSPLLTQLGFDADKLQSIANVVENSMENAFMGIVDGTMSAKDAFRSMAADIIRELYRVLVVQQLVGQFKGGGGGILGAIADATGHASGGSIQAGQPAVVGEHGRELFVPSSAGRVLSVPQAKAAVGGGSNVTIVQNINVSTGVQQTVRAEIKSLMPQIADSAKAAVLDAKRRGGSYGGAFA
jgi:hypothetical protein